MLHHHIVVIKEWRDAVRDFLCRTILSRRHSIVMQGGPINVSNVNKATVQYSFIHIMYHEFMVILSFLMAYFQCFQQLMKLTTLE